MKKILVEGKAKFFSRSCTLFSFFSHQLKAFFHSKLSVGF